MTDAGGVRRIGLVAAVVVLVAVLVQRAASRVFVLNFSQAGPNATALLVLGFLSVWTVPLARRLGWERSLRASVAMLPLAVIVSAAGEPVVAGVGAIVGLALATPWLVALGARDSAFVPGFAAGVCTIAALRGWLGTLPAYASVGGIALLVSVAFAAGALALQADVPEPGASAVAWLAVLAQSVFLAFPAATAAWGGTAFESTLLATVTGVVLGAFWVARSPGRSSDGSGLVPDRFLVSSGMLHARAVVVLAIAFALAWSDVVWVGELEWVAVFATQLAFVRLVAIGLRDDGVRWLGVAQGVVLLGVVGQVFAANWPFVPGGVLLAGHAPLALFVLGSAPVVGVLVQVRTRDRTVSSSEPVSDDERDSGVVDRGRRSAVASVVPAALAALSLAPNALATTNRRTTDGAGSGSKRGGGPPYRVVTLNVHQWVAGRGGGHNYRAVRDLLATTTPHFVGLQETEGGRYTVGSANPVRWLAEELDYHHVYGPATRRGGYGVSILSKHPIVDASVVSLPVHQSPPRWAVFATVDAPDGPLSVVSTHFQTDFHADDRQLAQAQTILGELVTNETDRAVVLGDCNVEPDENPTYDRLERDLVDAWTAAGNDRVTGGGTHPAWEPRRRIDYVWLDGDWTVSTARRVGDETLSDHLGVFATISPTTDS